jgi:hypothetical protein
MFETTITKPIYQVLTDLTQEPKLEVALPLAVKDLVWLNCRGKVTEGDIFQKAMVQVVNVKPAEEQDRL